MSDDRRPNTADIARASEEMRGHREEAMVNRPGLLEQPKAAAASEPPRRSEPAARPERATQTKKPDGLFTDQDATNLRKQWSDIQAGFVDEPRRSVQQADSLVADVMKR